MLHTAFSMRLDKCLIEEKKNEEKEEQNTNKCDEIQFSYSNLHRVSKGGREPNKLHYIFNFSAMDIATCFKIVSSEKCFALECNRA